MKSIHLYAAGLTLVALTLTVAAVAMTDTGSSEPSPVYGVRIPHGYRQWQLIAPAVEAAPLNEIRAVLGNEVAIKAYRDGAQPFPDGTVLAKLAWKHVPSPDFAPASIPGAPTTVQFMVKDSKKYAATGGWGFGRFIDGKPADEAQHRTCFACHQALAKGHDYVFTRYAP
ncbi:cytochrome P460 family protein [Dyella sp. BiH032]|uniref:cytochrome P460 family protein n=1 Tax=Dyella sp. BiH032 TaxID=3075430 RepID=UPI0028931D6E|nr:cytochrome P460 family protein [Dyella sp. BiH032]WNL44273.1 cytochrome P460 family protein [Dyella sp. BiH032]